MSEKKEKLLEVKDLKVSFFTPAGEIKAVGGISYDLDYGEVMGVVGESGSGKSQEAYSIIGLLQSPGKVVGGSITFEGQDMLALTKKEMQEYLIAKQTVETILNIDKKKEQEKEEKKPLR